MEGVEVGTESKEEEKEKQEEKSRRGSELWEVGKFVVAGFLFFIV